MQRRGGKAGDPVPEKGLAESEISRRRKAQRLWFKVIHRSQVCQCLQVAQVKDRSNLKVNRQSDGTAESEDSG